ncbi:TIGR03751 family conjugal transfer lipoprotein [Vibrio pectenicida]|uniref:TIGR03751 family conjugal transfer lipoprotein n=1 Tax=Vibrio pectenicida TaxID=62763 RepID=A0A3R9FQ52_9VIBR|nr:TIGR03751 family conjugal transfer lipoprotein [Vibrio pectenicida]RSD31707.1 TIGR03751 family conjugal transfer lipoprotein [Vibrio pectenicida]
MRFLNTPCRYALFSALLSLSGCSTNQEAILPQPDTDVVSIWKQKMGQEAIPSYQNNRSLSVRAEIRRQSDYIRDEVRDTRKQFPRIANPDVVLYVFPHRSGALPVPGYTTVFPLYERVHYEL